MPQQQQQQKTKTKSPKTAARRAEPETVNTENTDKHTTV